MSLGPLFRSPFTDLTGCLLNHQLYDKCGEFEMDMIDCLEAYGFEKGKRECRVLMKDFQECVGAQKQLKRVLAMRNERDRQYNAGEKGDANHYAAGPRVDAY